MHFFNKQTTYLVFGLGNPGDKYKNTRHNCGYMAIDILAGKLGTGFTKKKFNAEYASLKKDGIKVVLVKPLTYMNNSGDAVSAFKRYFQADNEHIIVIYDDIDLPVGSIRVRKSGSAGTHNGMRSIVSSLGAENFPRVRIGIGKPPEKIDLADYVLSNFTENIDACLEKAADEALKLIV